MRSKWYHMKDSAISLRKQGISIGKIESRLKIPRSTLSWWFRSVKLTPEQKRVLYEDWKNGLVKARKQAVVWHNLQKEKRLRKAENEALLVLSRIKKEDKSVLELALAVLYIGEGAKKNIETAIGSSDPLILKFFLKALQIVYEFNPKNIKCQLSLRADQNPEETKKFWAKELGLPLDRFGLVSIDKRTVGSKTYPYYKGVCHLRCGNVAIQRRLMYLGNMYLKEIAQNSQGS